MRKIVQQKQRLQDPAWEELEGRLDAGETPLVVAGLIGSARAFLVAALAQHRNGAWLVICASEKDAKDFSRDLVLLLGDKRVCHFPPWDALSVDMLSFQQHVELERAEILGRLLAGEDLVLVAPLKAAVQRVAPRAVLSAYRQRVTIGDELERTAFVEKLLVGGYRRVSLVEGKGEFSVRGNIIDVFPPGVLLPLRMEFMGDELESIRLFDLATQRSVGELDEFTLGPVRELIATPARKRQAVKNIRQRAAELELAPSIRNRLIEAIENDLLSSLNPLFLPLFFDRCGNSDGNSRDVNSPTWVMMDVVSSSSAGRGGAAAEAEAPEEGMDTLFSYLPPGSRVVLDDALAMPAALQALENQVDRLLVKAAGEQKFFLERHSVQLSGEEFAAVLEPLPRLILAGLLVGRGGETAMLRIAAEEGEKLPSPSFRPEQEESCFHPLAARLRERWREGEIIAFVCPGQEELQRLASLLERYELPAGRLAAADLLEELMGSDAAGRLLLVEGRITTGFRLPGLKLTFVSGEEIFGRKLPRGRTRPAREGFFLRSFGELKEGDFVVHTDHGIGLYRGLQKLAVGGTENDFLLIEYQDNGRLYIPVDRLDAIQRYIGPDEHTPKLDKLGGSSWENAKERVKKSIREVAEELVGIYAAREVMERQAFTPPDELYEQFSTSFEFEETADQLQAIADIHDDMNAAKPMDRLICGDAGFGKTEVALRAAFRAVMDGKQVAVLVPTTILAEQHYQTFTRRLQGYPLRVEVLDRMKSRAKQREIATAVATGIVDILIGTHRILQADITFRDLGLVIIDEEQRFGVSHKEKLKKLRTLVDVLTLTATPIPRTLQLSLVGIRDLSVINTPPEDRRPIRTYVFEFDEELIAAAIRQELAREGQVFFLHDRVRSIFSIARFMARLVPEARVAVVHGQMKPAEIEAAMTSFIKRERNVLVCTSIVASGIDIAAANTIIVNRADRFGLAQLYQIRGRVGRSREEAYAYLLVPKGAMLSPEARKRLQVITELADPGSGFRIAASDLEMRGAGNLLGISQSGHISAVGYELYTELMEKTIRELKGEAPHREELKPEINLGISAFIPEEYVADVQRRLVFYKRISLAASDDELVALREELLDLYGPPPAQVENLLAVVSLRYHLQELRVKKASRDGGNLVLVFDATTPVAPEALLELSRGALSGLRFGQGHRLTVPLAAAEDGAIVVRVKELLTVIAHQCSKTPPYPLTATEGQGSEKTHDGPPRPPKVKRGGEGSQRWKVDYRRGKGVPV